MCTPVSGSTKLCAYTTIRCLSTLGKLESPVCTSGAWQDASLNDGQKSCRIPSVHHLEIASCGTIRTRDQTLTSHEQPSLPCCTAKILKMLLKYFFLIRIKERRRNCISLSISKKGREGGQRLLTDVSAILPQNSWDIYGARSWATPRASSGRSKSYLASRFPYTANDTSTQQLSRIVLGGDIHKNPGPTEKRTSK